MLQSARFPRKLLKPYRRIESIYEIRILFSDIIILSYRSRCMRRTRASMKSNILRYPADSNCFNKHSLSEVFVHSRLCIL